MQLAFGNDVPAMVPGMTATTVVNLQKLLRKFTKEAFPAAHELTQEQLNGFPTSEPVLKMKYGGEPLGFTPFFQHFITECHRNPRIDNLQKLNCFKNHLTGKPKTHYANWTDPEHYEAILLDFYRTYFDKNAVTNMHVSQLEKFPPAHEDPDSLMRLEELCVTLNTHLDNHDQGYYINYKYLKTLILARLPARLQNKFDRFYEELKQRNYEPYQHGRWTVRYATNYVKDAYANAAKLRKQAVDGKVTAPIMGNSPQLSSYQTSTGSTPSCMFCGGPIEETNVRIFMSTFMTKMPWSKPAVTVYVIVASSS